MPCSDGLARWVKASVLEDLDQYIQLHAKPVQALP
jgi:hypothetical protein